jgi:hypothetical protein
VAEAWTVIALQTERMTRAGGLCRCGRDGQAACRIDCGNEAIPGFDFFGFPSAALMNGNHGNSLLCVQLEPDLPFPEKFHEVIGTQH